ncbi:MAG TPA: hypothetical protein VF970_04960 [Gemmatimonadales bacterium]|jgi:hypothetical protein
MSWIPHALLTAAAVAALACTDPGAPAPPALDVHPDTLDLATGETATIEAVTSSPDASLMLRFVCYLEDGGRVAGDGRAPDGCAVTGGPAGSSGPVFQFTLTAVAPGRASVLVRWLGEGRCRDGPECQMRETVLVASETVYVTVR